MRYIVVGLGAIGGGLAARLHLAGLAVVGVGRGENLRTVAASGLLLRSPRDEVRVRFDVTDTLAAVQPSRDDVVVLATKSQDTAAAVRSLAGRDVPIVSAQNGITNEPELLRWSSQVYGMTVMSPCVHLEPGVVLQYGSPMFGILDLGRYPSGSDERAQRIAEHLRSAGYRSDVLPDVSRWKAAKLVTNLGNAVEAVCGPAVRGGPLTRLLESEARGVLEGSGVAVPSTEESERRYHGVLGRAPIDGIGRPGGSLWQSAVRGTPTEVDYLNGEVVRLARLAGSSAPANALLQALTHEVSAGSRPVGSLSEGEVLAMIEGAGRSQPPPA